MSEKYVDRNDLDVGQFPDALEYEVVDPDSEVRIKPKTGFTLGGAEFYFGEDWRLRADGTVLYVEWNNAGTWEEQGRFEAP